MIEQNEHIEDLLIEESMKEAYLTYAMSVIISRALPRVEDGLKPSQRRILVAMNDLNLGPRTKHRKCAKIVGDTSGNYHPHGDAATYGTLVRMAQRWVMSTAMVDPQGNFGNIDGDPPAAMRYTEARLTAAAVDMLEDLKRNTVDFVPNYDETRTEPVVLPSKFPNLLVNGASGIAVGMATSIPPHNVAEVCEALIRYIDNPDVTYKELLEVLPGPDFPTGGTICGRKGIIDGYTTGRGQLTVRAKLHSEQIRSGKKIIVVTEIPYQVMKTTIVERIADGVRSGTIQGISDINDESGRDGMRIVIELKRDADEAVVINQLFRHSSLQTTFSIMNIALVRGRPLTLPLRDVLAEFVAHRKEVITRRTQFLLDKALARAHILEGLILAVADIDGIVALIKASKDVAAAKQALMKKPLRLAELKILKKLLPEEFVKEKSSQDQFLTDVQTNAILQMQLQRLTGLEIEKLATEYAELTEEIKGHRAILAQESLVLDIIREDLYEIRDKYGHARRTEIVGELQDFDIEDLIAEEDCVVTISHGGYLKRMPLNTYRRQGRGGKGIIGSDTKEGDWIEFLYIATTHDYLLFFSDRGKCYWLKVYDMPQLSRTSKGRSIANLIQMSPGEKIASILPVREFDERMLVMATQTGQIKKTPLGAYSRPRKAGIQAIKLADKDNVIGVALTNGSDEIVLGTADGKSIRFSEQDVRAMGRVAAGVHGIKLRKGDEVVDMIIVEPQASLLTVCEHGFGKRTDFSEYRPQGRGGLGLINIQTSERNGKVVALKCVRDEDELMMISSSGKMVRTAIAPIRAIGRSTQGVRLIRLNEPDKLVAVARVATNGADKQADDKQETDNQPSDDSNDKQSPADENQSSQ